MRLGRLVVRELEVFRVTIDETPVVFDAEQLGALVVVADVEVEVEDTTEVLGEEEAAVEVLETEDEDGAVVVAVLDVLLVVVVVEEVELERATYAPTIITSITITTMPIMAPLARALFWPNFLLGILVRSMRLHKINHGIITANIYFENRLWFLYTAI